MKDFLHISLNQFPMWSEIHAKKNMIDDGVLPEMQVWQPHSVFIPRSKQNSFPSRPDFFPFALWRSGLASEASRLCLDGTTDAQTSLFNSDKIFCNEDTSNHSAVTLNGSASSISRQFQQMLFDGIIPQTVSNALAYDRKAVMMNLAKLDFATLLAEVVEGEYAIKGYASGDVVRGVSLSSCQERDQKQKFQIRLKVCGTGTDRKIYITDLFGIGVMSLMPSLSKNPTLSWIEPRNDNLQLWQVAANSVIADAVFRSWGSEPRNHSWSILQNDEVLRQLESTNWIRSVKQNPIFAALELPNAEHRFRLSFRKERNDVKGLAIADPNEPITADNIGFVFSLYRDSNGILRLRVVDVEKNERSRNGFEHEAVALAKNPEVDWHGTAMEFKPTWETFVKLVVEEELFLNHVGVHRKDGGFALEVTRTDFLSKLREAGWVQNLNRYACLRVADIQLGQYFIMTSCYRSENLVGQLGLYIVKRDDWKALAEVTAQVKFGISDQQGEFKMELIANQGRCSAEIFDAMNETVNVNWERAKSLNPNLALDRANEILKQMLRKHTHSGDGTCVVSRLADSAWIEELGDIDLFESGSTWINEDFVIRIYRQENGHDGLDVISADAFENIKTSRDRAFVRLRFLRDGDGHLKFTLRDALGNARREVMYALATNSAFCIRSSFDSPKQIRDFIALMIEEVLLHRQMQFEPMSTGWQNITGRKKFLAALSHRTWLRELSRVTGLAEYLDGRNMLFVFGMNLDGEKVGMLSVIQPTNRVWEHVSDNKAQVLFALSHDGQKFGLTRWDQKGYNSELIGRRFIVQAFDVYGELERFKKSSSGASLFNVYHHVFGGVEEVYKTYQGLLGEERFAELQWTLPGKKQQNNSKS